MQFKQHIVISFRHLTKNKYGFSNRNIFSPKPYEKYLHVIYHNIFYGIWCQVFNEHQKNAINNW